MLQDAREFALVTERTRPVDQLADRVLVQSQTLGVDTAVCFFPPTRLSQRRARVATIRLGCFRGSCGLLPSLAPAHLLPLLTRLAQRLARLLHHRTVALVAARTRRRLLRPARSLGRLALRRNLRLLLSSCVRFNTILVFTWQFAFKKEYETAIEYFNKVISLNEKFVGAYISLGHVYLIIGKVALAKEYSQKANQLGESVYSNMNLGHIYLIEKNEVKALKFYKLSLESFSDSEQFLKEFDKDIPHLQQYGIGKKQYDQIVLQL